MTQEEKYTAFLRVLDPKDDQTGGGAASAVAGAMAASLVGMVARLSVGRKNMPESESFYRQIDAQARALADSLLAGSNADSQAFDSVMNAYRLPKSTDEEKARRSEAIQQALLTATQVPLQNAEHCVQVLALVERLEGRSNPNAASDLECARYLAQAGLRGALSNARVNLTSIRDSATRAALSRRIQDFE